ncbi:hypothetical protein ACQR1W_37110 [Bradyrhizobium sp. HKCCYLS1011]|uniref:hypothetical protein n=1 Tax=Bradyrhizobium sp. HKCCYLS1011 TaxID=3420733 RepID=UPI003EB88A90
MPAETADKEMKVRRSPFRLIRSAALDGPVMPLRSYLLWVGGALLLLFAADGLLPETASSAALSAATNLPPIRIRSEVKGPEAVVIDTGHAAHLPAQPNDEAATSEPGSPTPRSEQLSGGVRAPDEPPTNEGSTSSIQGSNVRETFAQFVPPDRSKPPKASRHSHRPHAGLIARHKGARGPRALQAQRTTAPFELPRS